MFEQQHREAIAFADEGDSLRRTGNILGAIASYKRAFELEKDAALRLPVDGNELSKAVLLRSAISLAIECNEIKEAYALIEKGLKISNTGIINDEILSLKKNIDNITKSTDILPDHMKGILSNHVVYKYYRGSTTLGQEVEILDFRDPDRWAYSMRYMCTDHMLMVYGDSGCAIYRGFSSLKGWSNCDIHYFASKCEASEIGKGYKTVNYQTVKRNLIDTIMYNIKDGHTKPQTCFDNLEALHDIRLRYEENGMQWLTPDEIELGTQEEAASLYKEFMDRIQGCVEEDVGDSLSHFSVNSISGYDYFCAQNEGWLESWFGVCWYHDLPNMHEPDICCIIHLAGLRKAVSILSFRESNEE